jgi:hypothetical protein
MISHVILHYNRPWLLKTHIELIKKYSPSVSQIIVADDGSDPEVISYIKNIGIDDIFVQQNHKFEWKKSSASNTLRGAFSKCKNKYVSFSEDDFFLWPCGIDDRSFYNNGEYPDSLLMDGPDALEDCLFLFSSQNAVIVQPSRDKEGWKGVPLTGKSRANKLQWCQMDHKMKSKFYYSNWPWVMRLSTLKSIEIPKDAGMWTVESSFYRGFDKKFGLGNWNWCAQNRLFVHVGLPFSKKDMRYTEKTQKSAIRNEQSKAFAKSIGFEEGYSSIDNFNNMFLSKWIENKKEISIKDLASIGLRKTFENFAHGIIG